MPATMPKTKEITSRNPATGESLETYREMTDDELNTRLRDAEQARWKWELTDLEERTALLRKLAEQMREAAESHAQLMTAEMGKPIKQARAEIEKCAWLCDYYAENAAGFLKPEEFDLDASATYVRFDPLGGVLAVMPWNFPFWQVFRCAVPALAAGNVVFLKHASNVWGCALAIEEAFRSAGFPPGTFTTLRISSGRVSDVLAHPLIRGASLTGSDRAGKAMARDAGEPLVKMVLELGGSDPFIVLEDADLEAAVATGVKSRTQNSGQSCISAKRFLVHRDVHDQFVDRFVAAMEALSVGDPTDESTAVGPQARDDLRDTLHEQVRETVEAGATLRTGGEPMGGSGFFYPPTVLTDVAPGTRAFDEETFGPVAAVTAVDHAKEAVALANRSVYGLGASVWTRDRTRAEQLAAQIDSGMVFVNEMVKSDPRVPFGGVKNSGYGRELGRWGIREFTNAKTVWVA